MRRHVERPGVRAGYDLWSASYGARSRGVGLAERYTVDDYLNRISDAGFRALSWHEYAGDERLEREVPGAAKYLGRPLLLLVRAERVA